MPYQGAQLVVRSAGLKSRKEFGDWWEKYKPISIPKMPHRVYPDWGGWGDFLGTDNTFQKNTSRQYRPFWEAIRFVHSLGLAVKADYAKAYEAGKIPSDIPKAPQTQYKEWVSWDHWIGKNVKSKIDVAKTNVAIFGVCARTDLPSGYFECIIDKNGLTAFKESLDRRGDVRLVKAYKWDPAKTDLALRILAAHGSKHETAWLIRNINALLFDLDGEYEWA